MYRHWRSVVLLLVIAFVAVAWLQHLEPDGVAKAATKDQSVGDELVALRAEVERLKSLVPDQAHAMSDVDYHFSNLWFAGKAENWPLAEFYWKETLSHLRWAVRIIPVRKDSAGREVKLDDILQSIEQSPFMQMGDIISKKDASQFEKTYRYIIEGCYSCHKASEKPFLRPGIPEHPGSHMIDFDPNATWPK